MTTVKSRLVSIVPGARSLSRCRLLIASVFALLMPSMFAATVGAQPVDFNRDIRPILSNNCFHCHGPDAHDRQGDLRLDVEEDAKASAVVPGDLDCDLIERITTDDEDMVMPPAESGKKLTAEQVDLLKRWVEQDAPWAKHWAYETPVQRDPPDVTVPADANWIDQHIHARLQQTKLSPVATADPVTLIRRLSFDLTGLPPTPEQVERVAADLRNTDSTAALTAYERFVDQLLDSPQFGERLAVYWLDLVRYADTVGYHGDQDHNISPYRDYVIDALNRNLPFDQFTREQLAGDLLPDPTIDQRVATGYNRLLQTSHEGGVQPKEYLAIYQADRVRNVSAVWLGGTLGCAQCHDHKYDPYTAHDFYAMAAFFADIDEAKHFSKGTNNLPTARPPELDVHSRLERQQLADLAGEIQQLKTQLADQPTDDAGDAAAGGAADDASTDGSLPTDKELRRQIKRLLTLEKEHRRLNRAKRRTMVTVALEKPRAVRLLPRGNWLDDSGPLMQPAVPEFLGSIDTGDRRPTRLDLANWLVDAEHGVGLMTARVMVNRFWYLMFGAGLSNSLEDFGGQGTPPEHPELLDNLAWEFVNHDWDIKHIVKLMVMSRTYRQSSAVSSTAQKLDPENTLLARQNRYRLSAEMIRDGALMTSGLLVDAVGGGSVKPYQPAGYYRHLNFPQRRYAHHADQRQWRRGVYVHWQRQFLHPMLKAFDAPTREECTARRPRSNTPLAALVLLNDPTFLEAARGLAGRVLSDPGLDGDTTRLQHVVRLVLSRNPDLLEQRTLQEVLDANRAVYREHPKQAQQLLSIGESAEQEQSPAASDAAKVAAADDSAPGSAEQAEWAAWTAVCRVILNLGEATTRQ